MANWKPPRRWWLLAMLGISAAAALSDVPAHAAQPKLSMARMYLPYVSQMPLREPCGPPVSDPCAPAGSRDWVVVCGGFGRVRDLVIPTPGVPGESLGALAIGDGAAELSILAATTPGADHAVQWRPQIGVELTGLNALSIDLGADVAGVEAWAVGERDRIVGRVDGCWQREEQDYDPGIDLLGVHANAPVGGWAVGQQGAGDAATGVMHILTVPTPGQAAVWQDYPLTTPAPPLTDVSFNYTDDANPAPVDAWAVGNRNGEGIFLYGEPRPGGFWRWSEVVGRPGTPRELTLRAQGSEGWAFGAGHQAGVPGLTAWHYARSAELWEQDEDFFEPDRGLVDMYTEGTFRNERLWVGISPAEDLPALAYLDLQSRRWVRQGISPADFSLRPDGGNRAIAPDSTSSVVYAWANDVWLFERPTSAATAPGEDSSERSDGQALDNERWTLLRRSRPLAGFLPDGDGGWAIASGEAGNPSALLAYRAGAFQPLAESALRLTAMDGTADTAWIVGEDGTTLVLRDGHWRTLASTPTVKADFLDVAMAPAGDAWAAGTGDDGHGRLWHRRLDAPGWVEVARTEAPTPLRGVTALADGRAWAVGDACVAVQAQGEQLPVQWSAPCASNSDPVDLVAVAASAGDAVFAAGAYYVYRWDGRRWRVMLNSNGGNGLWFMANGERMVALAAKGQDVWGVYQAAYPRGREASTLIRLSAGQWRRETVFNVPVREIRLVDAPDGRRSVWLAGDGATVARLPLRAR
jgi:hypothetical protein